ncbi:unnamed protein product [Sphagnum jensenii]|uniref:RNA-dependent RNA polymerase n=1 Tax=Sphagnum jensenii TaxID=128206 RepID=A0ABP0WPB2_9BRYO
MGPRKAFVSNIPYEAIAADLVGFLESVVGEGGIHSAELKKNGNIRNNGKATVHFEDEEKGELVQQLAMNKKLLFRTRALRVKLDRAVVQTPKHSLILLENNLLSFACLSKKDEVRVLWSSNPTVNTEFDFATRRLRFLFSVHGTSAWKLEYKMEFIFRDLHSIEPVTIHSTTTTALLLQLNNPPRIYCRKMSLNKESILLTNFNYFKEEKEEPWVRATDFTSAGCIGQSLAYVIELPGISKEDLDNVVKKLADYKIAPYPYREWKLHLRNGESYASPQMLVPIVEPPVDTDIDFELIFKINTLVQFGRLCGLSLNHVFYKLLEESSHVPKTMHIVELVLQNIMNSAHPCWDPIKQVQNALAKYSRENIRIPSISVPLLADGSSIYVHRLLVTPTKVYCQGPDIDFSNRVTRHFANEIHNFLRVTFTDEDYEGITSFALTGGKAGERTQLYDRVLRVMQEGLTIGGKHYEFLAFSASQLRDRSFWMFASNERNTASEIRAWMGDFLNIRNVAKCAARMGQCFSSSVPTLDVCAHEVEHIPDIERTDRESGTVYCFSDGIGKISEHFARKVVKLCNFKKMPIALTPSAFQIRYGGYKGVVAVDPDLDPSYKIALRPSMRKFTSTHTGLEVLSWSKFLPSYLNRQIIGLLSTLGVKDEVFEEMQLRIVGQLDRMLTDPFMAIEVLQASSSGESQVFLTKMLRAGYHPQHEPYLASMLQTFRATQLLNLRTRSRIFVPKGGVLMGCLDETSILEYGQVFLQLTLWRENQRFVDDGLEEFNEYYCGNTGILARVVTGPVVVAKNPCVHPGDVRVLMAVDEPSLHHMVNCLMFPQNGDRPHPNECSGSDLDGDLYFVSWDEYLIPPETDAPMDYTPAPEEQLDHPVTVEELQEFFVKHIVNDNLGQISNAHVVHVDLGDDNARSANCKELARLFSVAVDFPKTGVPATIPYLLRPDRYPDFMEKEDKEMYKSHKIIGKLFRSVKEASSENITSQISRDLIRESYDSTLMVLGYEEYVDEASSLKNEYDQKLMGLMNRYGIKTEAEVMSNNILQMSRPYHKRNEDVRQRIQLSVSALRREARRWFFEGDDDNEEHEESRYGGHENYAKASAWYHVTYCADFLGPREDRYLLSFPWVVYDVLLAIKRGCISCH